MSRLWTPASVLTGVLVRCSAHYKELRWNINLLCSAQRSLLSCGPIVDPELTPVIFSPKVYEGTRSSHRHSPGLRLRWRRSIVGATSGTLPFPHLSGSSMVPFSNQRMSITIVIYTVCDCEDWFSGMKLLILVIFLIQLLVSAGGCSRGVLSLLQLLQPAQWSATILTSMFIHFKIFCEGSEPTWAHWSQFQYVYSPTTFSTVF